MNPRLLCAVMMVAAIPAAVAPAGAQFDYGPDTCREGFVWREAFPGDHVCVTPEARAQAAQDNAQAALRKDPRGAYGPDTCLPGYVWREARPGDVVCVTPETRSQTAADNAQADARRANGSLGRAWRGAVVTGRIETEARHTQPSLPPPPDPRCQRYASRAVEQFRMTIDRPKCRLREDGRWNLRYQDHYDWCLTAQDAAVWAEERARDDHLYRCGAQVRFD